MSNIECNKISKKCIKIIENNSPEEAVKLMSNIKFIDEKKLGEDKAKKIYILYAKKSVQYDSKKYENNINDYTKAVNENKNKVKNLK